MHALSLAFYFICMIGILFRFRRTRKGGEGEFSKGARARKKEQHNCYIKCDDKQHYAEMRPGVLKSAKL